jgi:polysaccharide export outer membrane protein
MPDPTGPAFGHLLLAALLAAMLVGCAGSPPSFDQTPRSQQTVRAYRIGVPDLLELTVWQHPDVSGSLLVRRDGRVSVPLVGDVLAEGQTPVELAAQIQASLGAYISEPRVDIAVVEMRSQVASVIGGGIEREGQIELQRNTTVIEAIAAMGGLTPFAKKRNIRILRMTPQGQVEFGFNYTAFVRGDAPESNLLLEPGDTIIVPD